MENAGEVRILALPRKVVEKAAQLQQMAAAQTSTQSVPENLTPQLSLEDAIAHLNCYAS